MDDGAEQSRVFRIAGIYESGQALPEIEVTVKEFEKTNWVLERWGADCVIEPCNSNKENVCCAILKTSKDSEKKSVYRTTGWKLIDGKWEYLLPNDGKHDVRLFGKLRNYEKAEHWSDLDLQTVWSMMKEKRFAPKEIIWTLIALVFLTPLNDFFRQVFYEPKFVMCLIGRTGTRKSTLAALFLSFFGRFSGTDLPLSFSDTLNSILTNIYTLKVIFGLYKLTMVKSDNERVLLQDGQILDFNGIKVECLLCPGHTWGHMVYLVDDAYLFTGDTIWFGADGGYSFINSRAEDNELAKKSLAMWEQKLKQRGLEPKVITGHTGWTDDFEFVFRHKDKVCNSLKKQKPHDPSAPYDGYKEDDDTERNARSGFLPKVVPVDSK